MIWLGLQYSTKTEIQSICLIDMDQAHGLLFQGQMILLEKSLHIDLEKKDLILCLLIKIKHSLMIFNHNSLQIISRQKLKLFNLILRMLTNGKSMKSCVTKFKRKLEIRKTFRSLLTILRKKMLGEKSSIRQVMHRFFKLLM